MKISFGDEFERHLPNGQLAPLSDKDIARGAFDSQGCIHAPCVTWVKDYPGQVTDGRIGRPAVRYCPLDWHGTKRAARIRRRLSVA